MVVLKSFKLKHLSKKDIFEICKLKNSFWKFGIKSNLKWFKENVKSGDLNIVLKVNNVLVGYTLLRKRIYYIKNTRKKYFYLDTIIISKKFINKGYGKILLQFNNFLINKFNFLGFLLCEKKNIKFYKKFGWNSLNSKDFSIQNKDSRNLCAMSFNTSKKKFRKFYL